ncbi:MAG: mRNA surveillance protein pelota [Candidatus Nanohaloarchaeota archaeon QJJ-9]|nr:mRNA surveillance protein pelota [Candidatus Nanohaloarchaeota archaeon QJJ-9]
MQIIDQDTKEGYMKLKVEKDEDLWHLKYVIEEGDLIKTLSPRTIIEGREKKKCMIKLEVEKTDFQGSRLRTTGEIIEAPEDVEHGYHTFNLEPGKEFEVWKEEWKEFQIERVKKAARIENYQLLVCLVDKGEADFAVITETGIKDLADVDVNIPGKMYKTEGEEKEVFYGELMSVLSRNGEKVDRIILAGPGFEKENVYSRFKEEYPGLKDKVMLQDTSVTGYTGIQEVIKRGAVDKVIDESRVSEEVQLMEEFLKHLNKEDGKGIYKPKEVARAAEIGAVEKLLINDDLITEERYEKVMEAVENQGGEINIIHTDHEAGRKLKSLSGVAAVLRYEMD